VEVGQAVLALHVVDAKTELEVALLLILDEIGGVGLEHAALERLAGDLCWRQQQQRGRRNERENEDEREREILGFSSLGALYVLVPVVLVTRVLPTWRTLNGWGALISYHSLRVKGSILRERDRERSRSINILPRAREEPGREYVHLLLTTLLTLHQLLVFAVGRDEQSAHTHEEVSESLRASERDIAAGFERFFLLLLLVRHSLGRVIKHDTTASSSSSSSCYVCLSVSPLLTQVGERRAQKQKRAKTTKEAQCSTPLLLLRRALGPARQLRRCSRRLALSRTVVAAVVAQRGAAQRVPDSHVGAQTTGIAVCEQACGGERGSRWGARAALLLPSRDGELAG